jgi:phosphoribosylformylglycinamidine synthase subunit PurQ / glutaminase
MKSVKALILTGYGLNCDYETDYAFRLAGAESHRIHINEVISGSGNKSPVDLAEFQILVFEGGFAWADDLGAGVVLASKVKTRLGDQIDRFIKDGKLIIGICNGFQTLVNLGLLPGFDMNYRDRRVALTYNDIGNFVDTWVNLKINPDSKCIWTRGIDQIELPVRHGEGKFYASEEDIERLFKNNQVTAQYADREGNLADLKWPLNPNGSLMDIAGICDPSGKIFGLMPHPEAFHDYTNHPDWTIKKEKLIREGKEIKSQEGDGLRILKNAVEFVKKELKTI